MSAAQAEIPIPPIEYVSNERGTWAICKLCGTGLLGFQNAYNTQRNAIDHLFANHPTWEADARNGK